MVGKAKSWKMFQRILFLLFQLFKDVFMMQFLFSLSNPKPTYRNEINIDTYITYTLLA